MKQLIAFFILLIAASRNAYSHTGTNKLVCKSAKESGPTQSVGISLTRSNSTGYYAPIIDMNVGNQIFRLNTPSEMKHYGNTFHNSPLKVITATVEVPFKNNANTGYLTILAIPETVKAYDVNNKPVEWSLELEKDECNDSNGRATFQGIIHGLLNANGSEISIDAQVMDCELTYDSGMAC